MEKEPNRSVKDSGIEKRNCSVIDIIASLYLFIEQVIRQLELKTLYLVSLESVFDFSGGSSDLRFLLLEFFLRLLDHVPDPFCDVEAPDLLPEGGQHRHGGRESVDDARTLHHPSYNDGVGAFVTIQNILDARTLGYSEME
ncbi:hypothetical protein AVEN_259621-1 [Araneus ventricosus]|uniref:Uncharacterized protein n=1 Tax=Araneus ventricosus TaxID=182803 RepID=A0A4Y2N029_ARAVE|nr:hypothetical protein AVEN_259621-1 [Araneus ventricosus]